MFPLVCCEGFHDSNVKLSLLRLLWWRPECHHCVFCLLPAWQQLCRLPLHHGKPLPVRLSVRANLLALLSLVCQHILNRTQQEILTLVPSRYVVSSLEMLVAEDYLIIYMNGATPRNKMPGISWLKKCYQMIDRRSEKSSIHWLISSVLRISLYRSFWRCPHGHTCYFQHWTLAHLHHPTYMMLILTDMKGREIKVFSSCQSAKACRWLWVLFGSWE